MNNDLAMQQKLQDTQNTVLAVKRWLEGVVIGLGLCPFAKTPFANSAVRYVVAPADTVELLLNQLGVELAFLAENRNVETTLLIHPLVLNDFYDYNQFLSLAEDLLTAMNYDGIFQIASFHPQYQFGGTSESDAENYSNRSPYPMLHLLREESVEKALANYEEPENIPERNIRKLNDEGALALEKMLQDCLRVRGHS